jgi:D-glycero-alpha-D-manno-heptose 1-phosphate guanylyltransferase
MTAAVILAGGLGTRLRSVVPDVPKPMAKVVGRPFLEHLMDYWIAQGVSRFILLVGYKSKIIAAHFGARYKQIPIAYIVESEPLGTGGGLVLAAQDLNEPFLLLNGDTYFEVSLKELKYFHQQKLADWTIALFKANEADRYGSIIFDVEGKISELKTGKCQIGEFANGGVYLINPMVFKSSLIEPGKKYSLENEVLPMMVNSGKNIMAFKQFRPFIDIGIPSDYHFSQNFIASLINK